MPQIEHDLNRMSHGVTQLTYVGDDAIDSATKSVVPVSPLAIGAVAAIIFGSGAVRLAGALALGYALGLYKR